MPSVRIELTPWPMRAVASSEAKAAGALVHFKPDGGRCSVRLTPDEGLGIEDLRVAAAVAELLARELGGTWSCSAPGFVRASDEPDGAWSAVYKAKDIRELKSWRAFQRGPRRKRTSLASPKPRRQVPDSMRRLLQRFRAGDEVRAVQTILYATGEEVLEGTLGSILEAEVMGCTPLVIVDWVGRGGSGQPPAIRQPCSVESLEPVRKLRAVRDVDEVLDVGDLCAHPEIGAASSLDGVHRTEVCQRCRWWRRSDDGGRSWTSFAAPVVDGVIAVDADELERLAVRELDEAAANVARIAGSLEEVDMSAWNVRRVEGPTESGAVSPRNVEEPVVVIHAEEWEELRTALVRWKAASNAFLAVVAAKNDPEPAAKS